MKHLIAIIGQLVLHCSDEDLHQREGACPKTEGNDIGARHVPTILQIMHLDFE